MALGFSTATVIAPALTPVMKDSALESLTASTVAAWSRRSVAAPPPAGPVRWAPTKASVWLAMTASDLATVIVAPPAPTMTASVSACSVDLASMSSERALSVVARPT